MKEKKTIRKKSQLNFYILNYNYMIIDEREKNDKEKITKLNFYVLIIIII